MGRVGLFRRSLRSLVMVVYGFKGYFNGITTVVYRGSGGLNYLQVLQIQLDLWIAEVSIKF